MPRLVCGRILTYLLSALLWVLSAGSVEPSNAQSQFLAGKQKWKAFGFHIDSSVDLRVKVEGGEIGVKRVWEKDSWSFNPELLPLKISSTSVKDSFGNFIPEDITRGERKYEPGVYGGQTIYYPVKPKRGNIGTPPAAVLSRVSAAQRQGASSCYGSGGGNDVILMTPAGFKWVEQMGRQWVQYDGSGLLVEWGRGNFRIGRAVYGNGGLAGYEDTHGQRVITFTYNGAGDLIEAADYTGRKARYSYNGAHQIVTAYDPDDVRTTFSYSGKQLIRKVVGTANPLTINYTHTGNDSLASVYDQNGRGSSFSYAYDPKKLIFTVTEKQSGGLVIVTVYDEDEGVLSVTVNGVPRERVYHFCEDTAVMNRHNQVMYYDRDPWGRVVGVYYADGNWMKLTHHTLGWPEMPLPYTAPHQPWGVKQVKFSSGRVIDHKRNQQGRLLESSENLPNGGKRLRQFTYDAGGNRTSSRLVNGTTPDNSVDYLSFCAFDSYGNCTTYTDAYNNQWNTTFNSQGQEVSVIQPSGAVYQAQYSPAGRMKQVLDPVGYQMDFIYDADGRLQETHEVYDSNQPPSKTTYSYTPRGEILTITRNNTDTWSYTYDNIGNVLKVSDPEGRAQHYTYDLEHRLVSTTDGRGVTVNYEYYDTAIPPAAPQTGTPFNPIVKTILPTYTIEKHFDSVFNVVAQVITANSGEVLTTRYNYDAEGRLIKVTTPDNKVSTFAYDDLNRVTSSTSPGYGTSTVSYNDALRKITYTDPLNGQHEQTLDQMGRLVLEKRADNTTTSVTYDALSNLTGYVNSLNQRHTMTYDSGERVTKREVYSNVNPTGPPVKSINYNYNEKNYLLSTTDGSTSLSNQYDANGRLTQSSTNYGPFTKSHSYTYLKNDLVSSYTNPDGVTESYTYGAANELLSITIPGAGVVGLQYDPKGFGEISQMVFPAGTTRSYTYDDLRRLLSIDVKDRANNSLLDLNYSYQTPAYISKIQSSSGDIDYTYDSGGRIISAVSSRKSEGFTYDNLGNVSKANETWSYNPNGALVSTPQSSYTYDAQGARATKTTGGVTTKYNYNEFESLSSIESPAGNTIASYGYDPEGIARLWKDVQGTKTYFYYTPEGLTAEYDQNGNSIRSYSYVPGSYYGTQPLAQKSSSGYRYYQTDQNGTPRMMVDLLGNVSWKADYDTYGNATITNSGVTNPLRFAGQYYDQESALHYNLFRNYDAEVGAYLEQDPYGINTTGFNRYQYTYGNPASFIDPTGEITAKQVVIVTGVAAFGIGVAAIGIPALAVAATYAAAVATGAALAYEIDAGFPTFKCASYWFDRCVYRSDNGRGEACSDMWYGLAGVVTGETIGYGIGRAVQAVRPYIDDVVKAGKPALDSIVKWLKSDQPLGNEVGAIGRDISGAIARAQALNGKTTTSSNFRQNVQGLTGSGGAGAQAHHVFPQKFKVDFDKAGVNIHDPKYGAWWETKAHQQNAYGYNKAWTEFFRKNYSPTREEVLTFGRELMKKYGITTTF